MILIFGGTTEGRVASEVCQKANKTFFYSTKNGDQQLSSSKAQMLFGAKDHTEIADFAKQNNIRLIIDAAHPYAVNLHSEIMFAARELSLPIIRFERATLDVNYPKAKFFDSLEQITEHIKKDNLTNILALSGVNSARSLSKFASRHNITLRIMKRDDSLTVLERSTFPKDHIIFYDTQLGDSELCKKLKIETLITKESGISGGFDKKLELAEGLDLNLLILRRPILKKADSTVFGAYGLRREIERILPDFFELKTGFTTGSTATAATMATLNYLVSGEQAEVVNILLPNNEIIHINISNTEIYDQHSAQSTVIKDAGDDPDITHLIEIKSKVSLKPSSTTQIKIGAGEGVGTVTLPGLGIEVGKPAINPVPRKMIETNIREFLQAQGITAKVEVEISVPRGEELAVKTFNPRLGIVGGISILGTSGIVQPFSAEAFVESIQRQIEVSKALGINELIINSGAKSERFVKAIYPHLPSQSYVHYGNLVGDTLKLATEENIHRVTLGIMLGKAVKLAEGALDTHSKHSTFNSLYLQDLASKANCDKATIEQISKLTTARQLWDIKALRDSNFFELLTADCIKTCRSVYPKGDLELIILSDEGHIIGRQKA